MDRVRFIPHEGKEILLIDFSHANPALFLSTMEEARGKIAAQPPGSVLTLTDVTGAQYDRTVADALKDYLAHNKPFVKAGAVVGLNELKRITFNFVNRVTGRSLKAFDRMDEAKAWLARSGEG